MKKTILFFITIICIFIFIFLNIWKGFDFYLFCIPIITGLITIGTLLIGFKKKGNTIFIISIVFFIVIIGNTFLGKLSYPKQIEKFVYSGNRFYEEKLWSLAIREYKKAAEIDKTNLIVLKKLVKSFWNNNDIENAISMQKKIINIPTFSMKKINNQKIHLAQLYVVNAYKKYFPDCELPKPDQKYFAWDLNEFWSSKKINYGPEIVGPFIFSIASVKGKNVTYKFRTRKLPSDVENSFYQAERLLSQILEKDSENEIALNHLSYIKTIQGAYHEAIVYSKKLVNLNPHNFRNILELGRLYWFALQEPYIGQKKDGGILIKNINRNYLDEIENVIETLSERELSKKDILKYNSFILDVINSYIHLFEKKTFKLNQLIEKIIFFSQILIKINNDIPLAHFYLGEVYLLKKDSYNAKKHFDIAIETIQSNTGINFDFKKLFSTFRIISNFFLEKNRVIKQFEKSSNNFPKKNKFHLLLINISAHLKRLKYENLLPLIYFEFKESSIILDYVICLLP